MKPNAESLDQQLAGLPRTVEPPRDLWPTIAVATGSQPRARWPLSLAASVAVAALSAVLTWSLMRNRNVAPAAQVAASRPVTAVSFAAPDQLPYLKARASAEQLFHERLKLLRPDSRARIEANLQLIQSATTDIRHALEADPASPLLLQLLENTEQQEFDLYRSVTRNTEPALRSS
ncbi:MAG TPA: hypothetical protein VF848_11305 [Steroidobacteraceae bacterium]